MSDASTGQGGETVTREVRPRPYAAALVVMALLAALTGSIIYREQAERERQQILTDLDRVGRLKVSQLTGWCEERLLDAGMAAHGPLTWEAIEEARRGGPSRALPGMQSYLSDLVSHYRYGRAALVDNGGRELVGVARDGWRTTTDLAEPLRQAVAARAPTMWVPQSDRDSVPYLLLIGPVFPLGQLSAEPVGAVVVWIDARESLLPMVDWWPTAMGSGEVYLVRRDRDEAVRWRGPRARRVGGDGVSRVGVEMESDPAAQAVLGRRGPAQGLDGSTPVLAALHEVPRTPWILVSQVNEAAAMAAWRPRGGLLSGLVAMVCIALLAAAGTVSHLQARYQALALTTNQLRASQALVEERTSALAESEERFRRLFADSADPTLLLEGGTFVEGNAAALAALGMTEPEQLHGVPPYELSPTLQPDGEPSVCKALRMVSTAIDQGFNHFEWVHKRVDGTPFWVEVMLTSIAYRDRRLLHCVWRDITARKEAEATVREALQLNEQLLAAATVGVLVYDQQGVCRLANQAAAEALCMPLAQVQATAMAEQPAWRGSDVLAAADRAVGNGMAQQLDVRYQPSSGEVVQLECRLTAFQRNGEPHVLLVVADVTERRRAEARRRQLSDIIEATSDFVGTATLDGRLVYLNTTARAVLGVGAEDDLSGLRLPDLLPDWAARQYDEEALPAVQSGATWLGRSAFIDRTGAEALFSQVLVGHRGSDGELDRVSVVARDITAHLRAERLSAARLRLMSAAADSTDYEAFLLLAIGEIAAVTGSAAAAYRGMDAEQGGEPAALLLLGSDGIDTTDCAAEAARTGRVAMRVGEGSTAGGQVAVPVLRGDRVAAVIAVGGRATPYDQDDAAVLQLLGDLAYEVTERLRAEQARAEGEVRLREVTGRVPCVLSTALVVARPDWREHALDTTPEGCPFSWQQIGLLNLDSAQRLLPLDLSDGVAYPRAWRLSRDPEDQRQANLNAGHAFLSGASGYSNEWRCVDRHGVEHWQHQEVTIEPIDDHTWRVFGVATDITARRQAELAREHGEASLRQVTGSVPCILTAGVVTAPAGWRRDTTAGRLTATLDWSDVQVINEEAAQRLLPLDLAPGEAYRDAWLRSRNAEDQRQTLANGMAALISGQPGWRAEQRCTDRYGFEHWLRQEVTAHPLSSGSWHIFGVTIDVTDAKLAELARQAGEELMHQVTRNVPCILSSAEVVADEDWRDVPLAELTAGRPFRWVDMRVLNLEAAQDLLPLDVPDGETYHTAWREARDLEGRQLARVNAARALLSGSSTYTNDWRCVDRFGREHWQHQVSTVQTLGERAWRIFGITTDTTDMRRAQEEQQELLAELRRSNAELEQFAYVASHDLQEPLRLVSAYTELLLQRYGDRLDESAQPLVAFITDGVGRMQRLVQDLLLYSRVSTRRAPMLSTPLAQALGQALENLTVAIAESGAEVTADRLPSVPCDAAQVTQLLQNLVGNAIKFRRLDTPPRVHIGAEPLADGSGWRLTVQDNGIGIDAEYFERIFVIFQRLHTRRHYPGTGIGLALCKRIVERHGGQIGVESEVGVGTTFWFTLSTAAQASDNGTALR